MRMVLVTRKDLIPGYQSVQPAHALAEFAVKYPSTFKRWQTFHKNLVILSVRNEKELQSLLETAEQKRIRCASFIEPDIGNEMTAIALEPCDETHRMTSCLPLALKEYK
jgi:hypothetical protein